MKPSNCPACDSDTTQNVKILYESGASVSPELAKNIPPPRKPSSVARPPGWFFLYAGTLLLIIGSFTRLVSRTVSTNRVGSLFLTIGLVLFFLGCLLLILSGKELEAKKAKFEKEYAKWQHMWYCPNCGNVFSDAYFIRKS